MIREKNRKSAERKKEMYDKITDEWINVVIANCALESRTESVNTESDPHGAVRYSTNERFELDSQIHKLTMEVDSDEENDKKFQAVLDQEYEKILHEDKQKKSVYVSKNN